MRFRSILLLILLPAASLASEENAVLAAAVADLRIMVPYERQFARYVYVTDAKFESVQITALTLNYISRSSVLARPVPVGKQLVRLDARHYAPREKDLKEWFATWEKLAFDPRFSLLLTKDTLRFSPVTVPVGTHDVKVAVAPYKADDGQEYTYRWEKRAGIADGEVVRVLSPHIDAALFAEAATFTGSAAPVVNHRYFVTRALSTIRDKGVYAEIYGGLYYLFAGIPANAKKGTDEDALFEKLGIGDVASGVTAAQIFDKIRSDQRIAIFRSNVTGRPRRADFLRTLAGRDTQGILSVTHDLRQQDIDIGVHPVMNLLDFKDAARETIFEMPNGLHGFALFDGAGKRQDEVPPDVAADHTIPSPHGTRLQPAIGCIRCHASESGWRLVHNDVKKLTKLLDIFPDRSQDEIDRLTGLYGGDVERKLLPRGRDDYAGAILQASGPWKKGKKDQTEIAKVSAKAISDLWREYWYDLVDARQALAELGVTVEKGEDATAKLRAILPPPRVVVNGRVPEDPRIAALMAGLGVNRSDFDLVYSFMASRIAAAKKGAT